MINFIKKISKNAFKLGKYKLILVFFLILISTGLELLGISLIIPIVTILLDPTLVEQYKIDLNIKIFKYLNDLETILILFFLVFLLKYCITILFEYLIVKHTKLWERNIMVKLIDHHLSRPWSETLKNQDSIIKNIVTDIPAFIMQGVTGVLNIYKSILILSGIFIYLIFTKGLTTISIFILFAAILYLSLKSFKNYLSSISKKYGNFVKIKFNLTEEISKGLREIKIYNLKDYFLENFYNNERSIANIDIIRKFTSIIPKILVELFCLIGFLIIILINIENPKNIIPLLGLLAFIVYRSQPLITSLGSLTAALQIHSTQINEGIKILNFDDEASLKYSNTNYEKIITTDSSNLELKNVSFSYEGNQNKKRIFSDLNLSLKFGQIYGLMGKNGSGKSTFADLIIGLLKPQMGEINLNGKNIQSFGENWTHSISYLSQNYFLFNDTIKNNITLQNKNNKILLKEKYFEALKASNLVNEISKFENSDDTLLNSSGINLSGGQKQRIAIARLIYKNSNIIILDEPTASLDEVSSKTIIEMLSKVKRDKLILIISHSKDVLKQCDKTILIEKNKINFYND